MQSDSKNEFKPDEDTRLLPDPVSLQRHLLLHYLYSDTEGFSGRAASLIDQELWGRWHCVILIESEQPFFDTGAETIEQELGNALHRSFFYLNLNNRQSLLFFQEEYCDYILIANQMYVFLKRKYTARLYIAVSRKYEDYHELPQILHELWQEMEEKFYHPGTHIFTSMEEKEQFAAEETRDSQLMQLISEDVGRKDPDLLKRHFAWLEDKYSGTSRFSAMYVKFVFSSVIQALLQDDGFSGENSMEPEIDRIYASRNITQILDITRQAIAGYEAYTDRCMQDSMEEAEKARIYIREHIDEDLSLFFLAGKAQASPGHLNRVFQRLTGTNLNHYIWSRRMETAAKLLEGREYRPEQVGKKAGFLHRDYFIRAFTEYYGVSPALYGADGRQAPLQDSPE